MTDARPSTALASQMSKLAQQNSKPHQVSVEARAVVKNYGTVVALAGVDLAAFDGEFLTLLGPSGSGKTTMLNLLAGFVVPDAGVVALDGEDITRTPPHRREFGMVFQSYALFPHFTVEENVSYPLRVRHVPGGERSSRVREFLELVELSAHGGRYPHELSGGQQQRVALARALVFRPRILLMDEPLGALDRRLRQTLQFEIKRLHSELGMTCVYVTHDQEEALSMSDRIAVMRDGRIEQIDVPQRIYDQPETEFVASFLGETNFLDVTVSTRGARTADLEHRSSGQTVPIEVECQPGPARVSIRPEHLAVRDAGSPGGFEAEVTQRTFMGDRWRYQCRIGDDTVIAHAQTGDRVEAREGDSVRLVLADSFAVFFRGERASTPTRQEGRSADGPAAGS